MPKRVTRKQLVAGVAPLALSVPLARAVLGEGKRAPQSHVHDHAPATGHAAMIGAQAPAPGGPHDLDHLLYPPPALPHRPGRVREYTLTAVDKEIEVADGVHFAAWTYNGSVPGPVIRATEDDILRVRFVNAGSHPHTIHFHGIHPPHMGGVFEVVPSGGEFV